MPQQQLQRQHLDKESQQQQQHHNPLITIIFTAFFGKIDFMLYSDAE
jgi:hypothetical protein